MRPKPPKRRLRIITITLFLTFTAAVPISHVTLPIFHRWWMLQKLTADDPQIRAQGHAFVMQMATRDEKEYELLITGVKDRLTVENDRAFIEMVVMLDQLGRWARSDVSIDAWIRWLSIVATESDGEARFLAAQHLADMPEHAGDNRVIKVFESLIDDEDPNVRYNVLVTSAEMYRAVLTKSNATAAKRYAAAVQSRLDDDNEQVKRHAWLFASFIDEVELLPFGNAICSYHDVAEAATWAYQTKSDISEELLEGFAVGVEARTAAQFFLPYATAVGHNLPDLIRVANLLTPSDPQSVTKDTQLGNWRALLSLPFLKHSTRKPDDPSIPNSSGTIVTLDKNIQAVTDFFLACTKADYDNDLIRPLMLACIYRDAKLLASAKGKDGSLTSLVSDPSAILAMWEGAADQREAGTGKAIPLPVPSDFGAALRLAALRAVTKPQPADFIPVLISEVEHIRDAACIIAIERLTKEQIAQLVRMLWRAPSPDDKPDTPVYRFNHYAKMSGAILCGLTGVESQLLQQSVQDFSKTTWPVTQVMQIALWMQDLPTPTIKDIDTHVEHLLLHDQMPTSTVLLALLHKRKALALDYLLTPRGDLNEDLFTLVDRFRWWTVLKHYLPKDAPPFWVWADPDLQRFQLEVLRDWYVIHRYEMRSGW
jgi:hypothetical protein